MIETKSVQKMCFLIWLRLIYFHFSFNMSLIQVSLKKEIILIIHMKLRIRYLLYKIPGTKDFMYHTKMCHRHYRVTHGSKKFKFSQPLKFTFLSTRLNNLQVRHYMSIQISRLVTIHFRVHFETFSSNLSFYFIKIVKRTNLIPIIHAPLTLQIFIPNLKNIETEKAGTPLTSFCKGTTIK